ncbi:MAG: Maf family protein [bacterium]
MAKPTIILASASPRRKELLKRLVDNFTVIPSSVDEKLITAPTPEELAEKTALAKANDVAKNEKDAIVIGADTIVILGDIILGKPKDNDEAYLMLKSLSGTTHKVVTGLAVIDTKTGKTQSTYVVSQVKMKNVSDQAIKDYISTGSPLDKAGGYGVQEIEDAFMAKIDGDLDNVVGLPVKTLKEMLK